MLPIILAMGLLTARADDLPAPLAIPEAPGAVQPDPAPPQPLAAPEHPLAMPGNRPAEAALFDANRLQALRTYRNRRLTLHPETELHGGDTHVVGMGMGGPWGWGGWWGSTAVYTDPYYTVRTWGIYRGPQRLSVPEFLGTVGATDRKASLDHEIGHARGAARAWFTVAGIGGAGIVAGLVGMGIADTHEQWRLMNNITFTGSLVTIGGLLGGSFPNGKAARLERYPAASMGIDESQEYVDKYNDSLRKDLGLEPQDVWQIENRGPR